MLRTSPAPCFDRSFNSLSCVLQIWNSSISKIPEFTSTVKLESVWTRLIRKLSLVTMFGLVCLFRNLLDLRNLFDFPLRNWLSNSNVSCHDGNPDTNATGIHGRPFLVAFAPPTTSPLCSLKRCAKSVVAPTSTNYEIMN